jgi:hypothetical protein
VWVTSWDDEREAIEADRSFERVRDLATGPARSTHDVTRADRLVIVLRGVPPELHDVIRATLLEAVLPGLATAE